MNKTQWNQFESQTDMSARVGELNMYSYDTPAYTLWDAVARGLMSKGCTQAEAEAWLRSKGARWALDGTLGDSITKLGFELGQSDSAVLWAKKMAKEEAA